MLLATLAELSVPFGGHIIVPEPDPSQDCYVLAHESPLHPQDPPPEEVQSWELRYAESIASQTTLLKGHCSASPVSLGRRLDNVTQSISSLGGMAPSQYRAALQSRLDLLPTGVVVFSVGGDSNLWECSNAGGRTVFLEDNPEWASMVRQEAPTLEIIELEYTAGRDCGAASRLSSTPLDQLAADAVDVRQQIAPLLGRQEQWRVFHIDGPNMSPHGRLQPALASMAFACETVSKHGGRASIVLHDVQRECEDNIVQHLLLRDQQSPAWSCQLWPKAETTHDARFPPEGAIAMVEVAVEATHPVCLAIAALG